MRSRLVSCIAIVLVFFLASAVFLLSSAGRQAALRAMTIWAAFACFEEGSRGSLVAGKKADFVMLDRDIMRVPQDEIPDARVLLTFIGGEAVFTRALP